ncbi:hypothetical protein, partial [Marinitenerispora sediminis]|uniref:hypothetical protein n=1 Tax=Marinitenerispora sediminis TaxID=1931232 RepID=UPI001C6A694F
MRSEAVSAEAVPPGADPLAAARDASGAAAPPGWKGGGDARTAVAANPPDSGVVNDRPLCCD